MSLSYLEVWFHGLILRPYSGQQRGPALPDGRATRGGGMSKNGVGGRVSRPDRRARCIAAVAAIGKDDGGFGEWRSSRAVLVRFERHGYQTAVPYQQRPTLPQERLNTHAMTHV